MIAAV